MGAMDDRYQPLSLFRQASGIPLTSIITSEDIAARAYKKYLRRLTSGETAVDDWLEAERGLRQEKLLPRAR